MAPPMRPNDQAFDLVLAISIEQQAMADSALSILAPLLWRCGTIVIRLPTRRSVCLELELPTDGCTVTDRSIQEFGRIVEFQSKGLQPVAPVVERGLTDVIGPQSRGPQLPSTKRQHDVVFDNDQWESALAQHNGGERHLVDRRFGHDRQRKRSQAEAMVGGNRDLEPMPFEPASTGRIDR